MDRIKVARPFKVPSYRSGDVVDVTMFRSLSEGKFNFFTCTSEGYEKGSGDEFIAVGTSSGEIYSVQANGSSFIKEIAY